MSRNVELEEQELQKEYDVKEQEYVEISGRKAPLPNLLNMLKKGEYNLRQTWDKQQKLKEYQREQLHKSQTNVLLNKNKRKTFKKLSCHIEEGDE
jgi:hypothetical protein